MSIARADVSYLEGEEPTPAKRTKRGGITETDLGSPGFPSRFDVSFLISVDADLGHPGLPNSFRWDVAVPVVDRSASFAAVEAEAARQIAPMLRDVADQIEALVADFVKQHSLSGQ